MSAISQVTTTPRTDHYNRVVSKTAEHTFNWVHKLKIEQAQGYCATIAKVVIAALCAIPLFCLMAARDLWRWATSTTPSTNQSAAGSVSAAAVTAPQMAVAPTPPPSSQRPPAPPLPPPTPPQQQPSGQTAAPPPPDPQLPLAEQGTVPSAPAPEEPEAPAGPSAAPWDDGLGSWDDAVKSAYAHIARGREERTAQDETPGTEHDEASSTPLACAMRLCTIAPDDPMFARMQGDISDARDLVTSVGFGGARGLISLGDFRAQLGAFTEQPSDEKAACVLSAASRLGKRLSSDEQASLQTAVARLRNSSICFSRLLTQLAWKATTDCGVSAGERTVVPLRSALWEVADSAARQRAAGPSGAGAAAAASTDAMTPCGKYELDVGTAMSRWENVRHIDHAEALLRLQPPPGMQLDAETQRKLNQYLQEAGNRVEQFMNACLPPCRSDSGFPASCRTWTTSPSDGAAYAVIWEAARLGTVAELEGQQNGVAMVCNAFVQLQGVENRDPLIAFRLGFLLRQRPWLGLLQAGRSASAAAGPA